MRHPTHPSIPPIPVQTTPAIPDTDNIGAKWRGIIAHLRHLRNLRFRQRAQSPIQTTIGTKGHGASQPINVIRVIRGSDNPVPFAERSERRGCPGRSGRATSPLPRRERVRVRVQGEKTARGITTHLRKSPQSAVQPTTPPHHPNPRSTLLTTRRNSNFAAPKFNNNPTSNPNASK